MSFIDDFLEAVNPLPRNLVRYLKLYKEVEKTYKDNNNKLKNYRKQFLEKLKEKEITNDNINSLKNPIDVLYKQALMLSDYKTNILKEINYIIENSFLKKISPIIEKGKNECKEKIMQINPKNSNINNSLLDSLNNSIKSDNSKLSDKNKKKNSKFLGRKKKRIKGQKNDNSTKSSEDKSQSKEDKICFCNGKKHDENMIQCDKCTIWFHYNCVNVILGEEPENWYCKECQKLLNKKKK